MATTEKAEETVKSCAETGQSIDMREQEYAV